MKGSEKARNLSVEYVEIYKIPPLVEPEKGSELGISDVGVDSQRVEVVSQVQSSNREAHRILGVYLEVPRNASVQGKKVWEAGAV